MSALEQAMAVITRLQAERLKLRNGLAFYGNHTDECLQAPTHRCLCGFEAFCRAHNVIKREDP